MLIIPSNFSTWPSDAVDLEPAKIVDLYTSGFAGCGTDEESRAELRSIIVSTGYSPNGDDMAHQFGIADSYKGKLVLPYLHVLKHFPKAWPGAAQQRGDCVAHNEKNANLITVICEAVSNLPDEYTGLLEGLPEVPDLGIEQGLFSSEWPYWFRGYNGDGWSCDSAAVVTFKYGMMLRKEYPEIDVDFTKYSGSLAGRYGSRKPPEEMWKIGQQHIIRTATELNSFDEIRDFLGNGYGISSCGSEGFSSTRDENGVSPRKGSWAHAMAIIGADDRDVIKQLYGEPLVLVLNSWGLWNSGGTKIYQTNYHIPPGSFWAKWSSVKNRHFIAKSSANGWPRKNLPHFGTTGII